LEISDTIKEYLWAGAGVVYTLIIYHRIKSQVNFKKHIKPIKE
jgi:hypothetical protein